MNEDMKELFHSLYDSRYFLGEIMYFIDQKNAENVPAEQIQTAIEAAERVTENINVIRHLLNMPIMKFDQFKK